MSDGVVSDAGARERVALERCRFARERCVSDVSEVLVERDARERD